MSEDVLVSRKCSRCGESFAPTGTGFYCKTCNAAHSRDYKAARYGIDEAWTATYQAREKKYRDRSRAEAIAAYGGQCACCGEREPVFLDIDHINGGGTRERREGGRHTVARLRRLGWPAGFQVLCRNCNWAKFRGGCPHMALPAMRMGGADRASGV